MAQRSRLVTIHDRTGRLTAMAPEFALYFGVDVDGLRSLYPPFPWWAAEGREQFQDAFEWAISESARSFEGIEFVIKQRNADGSETPFRVYFEKLPDSTTAFFMKPDDHSAHEELIRKAQELGRIAVHLKSGLPPAEIDGRLSSLSTREKAVFDMLVNGDGADRIARELHISVHTARNHRKAVFSKLDVRSHVELIAKLGNRGDAESRL